MNKDLGICVILSTLFGGSVFLSLSRQLASTDFFNILLYICLRLRRHPPKLTPMRSVDKMTKMPGGCQIGSGGVDKNTLAGDPWGIRWRHPTPNENRSPGAQRRLPCMST